MSVFEHLSVYISIVIGLAVAQLLSGVVRTISNAHSRPYWVHLAWVFNVLCLITYYWWFTFDWEARTTWTYQLFLFVFGYAMVMYMLALTLVPPADLEHSNYEDFFFSRSRLFFSLLALRWVVDLGDTALTGGAEFSAPGFVPIWIVIMALYVVGASTKDRRVHAGLAGGFTLLNFVLLSIGGGASGS